MFILVCLLLSLSFPLFIARLVRSPICSTPFSSCDMSEMTFDLWFYSCNIAHLSSRFYQSVPICVYISSCNVIGVMKTFSAP